MELENVAESAFDATSPRLTRWIVCAADQLTPDYKRNVKEMRFGGVNLGQGFKSLGATKGLLRRCQLTPLVTGYDAVNEDMVGDEKTGVVVRNQVGYAYDDPVNPDKRKQFTSYAYEVLPGNDLESILATQQGDGDYGIREIAFLRGVEPPKRNKDNSLTESLGRDLQYEIFPDWAKYLSGEKEFFPTTQSLTNYLNERRSVVSDDAEKVIDILLDSNAAFERWATRELDRMSRLVKAPISEGGRAYGFEPVHQEWFAQLELNREEFLMKKDSSPAITNTPSMAEFNEVKAMLGEIAGVLKQLTNVAVARRPCAAIKADETPCKAFAKDNSNFCGVHQNYESD